MESTDFVASIPKFITAKYRYNADGLRICSGCRVYLPVTSFSPASQTRDRLNIYCRPCQAERVERHRQRDPERFRSQATGRARQWRAKNTEKVNATSRKQRRKIRAEVLAHYGDHCVCCGEREPDFLSLDHINGGGNKERKEVGPGIVWYYWLRKQGYPDGLQVLCYNCNLAKGFLGECPHIKARTMG
jgi:hypothetical protein